MGWLPIETYDKLKKKPKNAVFWFAEVVRKERQQYGLSACANMSRFMGNRVCTHWIELPDDPNKATD